MGTQPVSRGHFITFEGGEGAGKSTQIKRLAAWLQSQGHTVLITREPGGTDGAEAIRHVVLSGAARRMGTDMEALLFAAARSDNVEHIIKPALARGDIVLCDRFMDSTRVYQGVTGDVDGAFLAGLEEIVTEGAQPGLTLIFDIDPEEGLRRAAKVWAGDGPDRFESEDLAAQEKRRRGFLDIAKAEPQRCRVIDASGEEDTVARAVQQEVADYLDRATSLPKAAQMVF